MARVIYQVRLIVKPELEAEFNAWYEGEYIPKLMRETPHFTAVRRDGRSFNGQKLYVSDDDCTTDSLPLAIAAMRALGRAEDSAAFYRWKDRAITLHESVQLTQRLVMPDA